MQPATAPRPVTGAVTMAYVSAGVVGVLWLTTLADVLTGDAGIQGRVFLLTLPGLVGLVHGAGVLRRRARGTVLVVSAVATALVLAATTVVGVVAYSESAFVAFAAGPLLLTPLPLAAAALTGARR